MNCVIIDDDPIQHALIEEYLNEMEEVDCIGVFNNPIDFLKAQKRLNYYFIVLNVSF